MNVKRRIKVHKTTLALAAVLALSGNVWATPPVPSLSGDLNGNMVTVEITTPTMTEIGLCPNPAVLGATYHVKAKILQPSGRLLGFASGERLFNCDFTADQLVSMSLTVFPGLGLKRGPATIMFQAYENTASGSEEMWEYGYRINLH